MLISMEAVLLHGHAVEWRSFWAHWNHHDPKSEAGLLFGRGLPEGVEDVLAFLTQVFREAQVPASIAAEAAALRMNREAATYVDWPLRVQLPSAMTPKASADELIAFARGIADQVDLFGTIFDRPEVMEAWELASSAFASGDFGALRAVLMAVAPPSQA
jgi:AbiV family abortive infection protein